MLHLEESATWIKDRSRREEAKAKQQMEDTVRKLGIDNNNSSASRFVPPRQEEEEEWWRQKQGKDPAMMLPNLSSLTMKSEFDMLGSTNLNGCPIIPVVSVYGEVAEDCNGVRRGTD